MKVTPTFAPNRTVADRTAKQSPDDQVTTFVCTDKVDIGLVRDVRSCLSEELRKKAYRNNPNPMAGHCYVASETIYHKLGGKEAGWTPQTIRHEGGPHWFLKNTDGTIIDPTADQFVTPVPYEEGKGCGFLTRRPSKRSQQIIERVDTLT
jgi:hypothetical protein